jgi:hypothetical protein
MKDYLIWLKSGEYINGTAKENTLKMLWDRFNNHEDGKEIISFIDEDGAVIFDMDRVEAIAVNKCFEDRKAGF